MVAVLVNRGLLPSLYFPPWEFSCGFLFKLFVAWSESVRLYFFAEALVTLMAKAMYHGRGGGFQGADLLKESGLVCI